MYHQQEITRSFRNTIVLRERSRMSSRGQCVKLPPIPGSSRDDSSNLSQSFERAQKDQDNLIKVTTYNIYIYIYLTLSFTSITFITEPWSNKCVCVLQSFVNELSEMERTSHQQTRDNLLKFHLSQVKEQALDFKTRLEELRSEYYTER